MEIDAFKQDTKERMEKTLTALERDFSKLRTGRASTDLLEGVKVDYYGTITPLSQMATISVPDSKTLTIQPWDRGGFSAIEKAIQKSDLGLSPVNDGKVLRIAIPPLTEERRKDLVKVAKKYTEEAKVALRNIRREANELLKKAEKDKELTEDEHRKTHDEVQKITDASVAKADEKLEKKKKDIMQI